MTSPQTLIPSPEIIEGLLAHTRIGTVDGGAAQQWGGAVLRHVQDALEGGMPAWQVNEDSAFNVGAIDREHAAIILAESCMPSPDAIDFVLRGYGITGPIASTNHEPHIDGGVASVGSILATGSDSFELWARAISLPDDMAHTYPTVQRTCIQRVQRTPGIEVFIDQQSATITDPNGITWVIEHGVTGTSNNRVAMIARIFEVATTYLPVTYVDWATDQLGIKGSDGFVPLATTATVSL